MLQEALTNALRHAGGARVQVQVDYRPDAVHLEVVDDGAGGDGATVAARGRRGHGLLAMRERVGLVGGSVRSGPRPEGGWFVSARLPVEDDARARMTS